MSAGIARGRLQEERKAWRKDHPIGFFAKPKAKGDGSNDLFLWDAGIPGKEGTDWAGGVYHVSMEFGPEYPSKPPKCEYTHDGEMQYLLFPKVNNYCTNVIFCLIQFVGAR